jgi:hypothetical protein
MFLKHGAGAGRSRHRPAGVVEIGFPERRGSAFATPIQRERFELFISGALPWREAPGKVFGRVSGREYAQTTSL